MSPGIALRNSCSEIPRPDKRCPPICGCRMRPRESEPTRLSLSTPGERGALERLGDPFRESGECTQGRERGSLDRRIGNWGIPQGRLLDHEEQGGQSIPYL